MWNQSLLYRVNEFGDPHPHPRYQGWFYRTSKIAKQTEQHISGTMDSGIWEQWDLFRLNHFEGTFEIHQFGSWGKGTSPLGAHHFLASGISAGGMTCQQGD